MSKRLSKYCAVFHSFCKALIVLSATRGGILKCYWSSRRNSNSKCKFNSCIFSACKNNKEGLRNNKK